MNIQGNPDKEQSFVKAKHSNICLAEWIYSEPVWTLELR